MKTRNRISLIRKTSYGVMMFAMILGHFGAWDLPKGWGQEAAKNVTVSLSVDRPSFGARDEVVVHWTITNPTSSSIRLLKWYTPLDGVERSLFTVLRNGQPVPYIGKMVKRPAPTEKDYITLISGESLTGDIDLSAVYDLSLSGLYTLKYNVAPADLYEKENGGPPQSTYSMESGVVEVFIEGRASQKIREKSTEVVTGANGFVGCSSTQQMDLTQARNAAGAYADNAVAYLAAGNYADYRTIVWFGAYDPGRFSTVMSNFNSIQNAINNAYPMTFDCSTCTSMSWYSDLYSYVYPNSPYNIYLCGVFWEAQLTGTDSKAGTLIHETSHFTVVADTDDYVYGQGGAQNLAVQSPDKAIMNADNYEGFAENDWPPSQSPSVTTGLATKVGGYMATLNGKIDNWNSNILEEIFQYGLTPFYGSSVTADDLQWSAGGLFLGKTITGLTTNTIYHYRIVVRYRELWPPGFPFIWTNFTTYGSDMTFKTGPPSLPWLMLLLGD